MPRIFVALLLAVVLGLPSLALASPRVDTGQVPQFKTEQVAQKHCPGDTVVWLNTYSGIWHYRGAKYWMNTKYGAFVCEKEAAGLGMRAARDGS
jgi:hypothetical protein